MSEIPTPKTPRILAAMKNLSTFSVTHIRLLHFEQDEKVLTVCGPTKSLVWRGFWRVGDVEKTEEGFGKKALLLAEQEQEKVDASSSAQVFFASRIVSRRWGRRNVSKLAGPLAGGMENTEQLHRVAAHAIGNDVWRVSDQQLPSAGHAPGAP
jgi:hypothetical protein